MSEQLPPGITITADGYYQNANGEYVDASGKVVETPVKAAAPKPPTEPSKPK